MLPGCQCSWYFGRRPLLAIQGTLLSSFKRGAESPIVGDPISTKHTALWALNWWAKHSPMSINTSSGYGAPWAEQPGEVGPVSRRCRYPRLSQGYPSTTPKGSLSAARLEQGIFPGATPFRIPSPRPYLSHPYPWVICNGILSPQLIPPSHPCPFFSFHQPGQTPLGDSSNLSCLN